MMMMMVTKLVMKDSWRGRRMRGAVPLFFVSSSSTTAKWIVVGTALLSFLFDLKISPQV